MTPAFFNSKCSTIPKIKQKKYIDIHYRRTPVSTEVSILDEIGPLEVIANWSWAVRQIKLWTQFESRSRWLTTYCTLRIRGRKFHEQRCAIICNQIEKTMSIFTQPCAKRVTTVWKWCKVPWWVYVQEVTIAKYRLDADGHSWRQGKILNKHDKLH